VILTLREKKLVALLLLLALVGGMVWLYRHRIRSERPVAAQDYAENWFYRSA
jgi:hypothetical protein